MLSWFQKSLSKCHSRRISRFSLSVAAASSGRPNNQLKVGDTLSHWNLNTTGPINTQAGLWALRWCYRGNTEPNQTEVYKIAPSSNQTACYQQAWVDVDQHGITQENWEIVVELNEGKPESDGKFNLIPLAPEWDPSNIYQSRGAAFVWFSMNFFIAFSLPFPPRLVRLGSFEQRLLLTTNWSSWDYLSTQTLLWITWRINERHHIGIFLEAITVLY